MAKPEYDMREAGTWDPSQQTVTETICPYCGVGCAVELHVQDEKILKVTSPLGLVGHRGPPLHQGPLRLRIRQRAPAQARPLTGLGDASRDRPSRTSSASTSGSGPIVAAAPLEGARKPAITLEIDFGPEVGIKRSSAQITVHYEPAELVGRQVAAVVNFPPRRIAGFVSEVLTLGFPDADGAVVLVEPDLPVPDGGRLF